MRIDAGCEPSQCRGVGDKIRNPQSSIRNRHAPAAAEFTGPDGGQTAHYMLRWLSTRGEAGPWSETASATIGA
ncbi:MAG: hypothetical protein KAY37_13555 [Phycisphaerae bacterium]|nr:hypothetical protein [Phycisphaerae bacterium]